MQEKKVSNAGFFTETASTPAEEDCVGASTTTRLDLQGDHDVQHRCKEGSSEEVPTREEVIMNVRRTRCITALLAVFILGLAAHAEPPASTRTEDVVYGRKYGVALTLDVFKPEGNARGPAVIYAVSGGWFSSHEAIRPAIFNELLARGYTVFAVVHGSQPKFTIPEIVDDMHRAVRFVRHHADRYGIDPDRIGITGSSAGGHLSLMIGMAGKPGDPEAKDPVDRASSRVQAVACFFPPTDFLNYARPGRDVLTALDEELVRFKAPFDFCELDDQARRFVLIEDREKRLAIIRDISPITHVTPDDPPTLILHGDADRLVPIQQSEDVIKKLEEVSVPAELVVRPGAGHGWGGHPQRHDGRRRLV
jgi:acetyl esterase/lipase